MGKEIGCHILLMKNILYLEVWRMPLLERPIIYSGSCVMYYRGKIVEQYKLNDSFCFYA